MLKKLLLVIMVLSGLWVSAFFICDLTPQKFLKLSTIREHDNIASLLRLSMKNVIDPGHLISKIPYRGGRFVDVLPERRYRKSLVEGKGDCSILSGGLAFLLLSRDVDFAMLHLLWVPGFPEGKGHVAMSVPVEVDNIKRSAIVDLQEGGLVIGSNGILSAIDLSNRAVGSAKIRPFHSSHDDRSKYYSRENLDKSVVGVMPKNEIQKYYAFVSDIYINLGHRVIERYVFDVLALMVGVFPRIYISSTDALILQAAYGAAWYISQALLWAARLLCLLAILLGFMVTLKLVTWAVGPRRGYTK